MTYDETIVGAAGACASNAGNGVDVTQIPVTEQDTENDHAQLSPDSVSSAPDGRDRISRLGKQIERVTRMLDRRLSLLERNMLSREDADAWRAASEARLRAEFENRLELSEARVRQRINAALSVGGRRLDEIGAGASARLEASEAAIADLRGRIEAIEARRKPAPAEGLSGEIGGPGPLASFGAPDNPVRQPPALAVIEGGRLRITPEPAPDGEISGSDHAGPLAAPSAAVEEPDTPAGLEPEDPDTDFDPRAPRTLDGPGRFLMLAVAAGVIALIAGAGATVGLAHESGAVWAYAGAAVTDASPR